MGDIIAIIGITAAGALFFVLMFRGFAELGIKKTSPPVGPIWYHGIALIAIALCSWQYFGEEDGFLQVLYTWNQASQELLPLLLINNAAFVAAAYALYAHLRRGGFVKEAHLALIAMSCLPFLPLGTTADIAGVALLFQVLAYAILRERKLWGLIFVVIAQLLDARSIFLLPVFAMISKENRKVMGGVFLMVPIFLAQVARGEFSFAFEPPVISYYSVIGVYIPAALCIATCALLCRAEDGRYGEMRWLLLFSGIAPFMMGQPFISFALPLAVSLQKSRLSFRIGILSMLCANALYISMRLLSPEVMP